MESGKVRLLADATAPTRRVLQSGGGLAEVNVSGAERVLNEQEIAELVELARGLPQRFPHLNDAVGNPAPADIEFGFLNGKLKLFQIRPFLESVRARNSSFLRALDRGLLSRKTTMVTLDAIPTENMR